MKISSAVGEIECEGVGQESAFSIEFNDKMAKILSKGIYQNVIRAPIRELVCNAWDSHLAAGKSGVPVQVHLPNSMEPYFEVRDFGVGLSDSAVTRLYTRYGASDKSHNNDAIGGFGLGSKAPFAYTSTFTVSSVYNGVRRVYAMYMNSSGLPSVSKMGEEPTTDCNGVTVNVPVKPGDFESFRENAQETFRWFDVPPVVSGNNRYAVPELCFLQGFEGANWRLQAESKSYGYGHRRSGAVAVMANVAYPIRAENLNQRFRQLASYPLIVRFENGELEPAVSREDLNYDPATIAVLETRLDGIMRDLAKLVEAKVNGCATLWQARVAVNQLQQDRITADILRTLINGGYNPSWKGTSIEDTNYWYWNKEFNKENPGPAVYLVSENYRARAISEIALKSNSVFVLKDCANASSRCRAVYYKNPSCRDRVYLIEGPSSDGWNATKSAQVSKWLKLLGDPPTILASSLPKTSKTAMKFKGLAWTGRGSNWYRARKSSNWGTETELTTAQGGYYVTIEGLTPWNKHVGDINMNNIYECAVEVGIIPRGTQVWGINKTNSKLIAANPAWKEIYGYVKTELEKLIVKHNIADMMAAKTQLSEANSRVYGTANEWHSRLKHFNNEVGAYVREWHRVQDASCNTIDVNSLRRLATAVGVQVNSNHSVGSLSLSDLWDQIIRKYPLLKHACRIHPNHDGFDEFVDYIRLVDTIKN